ncbi:MAG TPA: serine/threonine-protein kinase [Polyangiaceae bacterium]|nr:serine/threonine-protein kinase [Polyangiaceae bacterium]
MREPLRSSGARVGTRLGPYRLDALLGDGGMGEVYQGVDVENGREVAVKILAEERSRDPAMRARFQREWEVMRGITHPNVVALLDWPEPNDGPLHFVMELLAGETLHERMEHEGALALDVVLDVFAQAADGLAAVHAGGIVHRDVKPENVFLCADPEGTVKILDFGLARIDKSQITGMGTLIGTPSFLAPEQATGDPVDARTDIYALGLILYRALTGVHPFATPDKVTMLGHQLFSVPPPFGWFVDSVPVAVERLVRHMLRKLPQDRPSSMAIVAASIRRLADDTLPPLESPPPPNEDRYGPLNPLAEALVRNALTKKGFRIPEGG